MSIEFSKEIEHDYPFMNNQDIHSHSLRERIHFMSRFFAQPHAVGSIWPSSRYLGRAMLQNIFLKEGDVVVEYGPGTGPFTAQLRPYLAKGVRYLGIERDDRLYETLQSRFPEMKFHHGSAEEVSSLLEHYKLPQASLIISGLPFANMSPDLQQGILEATSKALSADGVFRTFTYLFSGLSPRSAHFQKIAAQFFQKMKSDEFVLLNLPPAKVMSFSKKEIKNY